MTDHDALGIDVRKDIIAMRVDADGSKLCGGKTKVIRSTDHVDGSWHSGKACTATHALRYAPDKHDIGICARGEDVDVGRVDERGDGADSGSGFGVAHRLIMDRITCTVKRWVLAL